MAKSKRSSNLPPDRTISPQCETELKPAGGEPTGETPVNSTDTNGPPTPVTKKGVGINEFAGGAIVLATGATTLFLIGGRITSTHGATRSARLEWSRRQAEIQRVMEDQAELERQLTSEPCDEEGTQP